MRPDAHKKKASTAYKKKHGMVGEKKPTEETGKGRGRKGKTTPVESDSTEAKKPQKATVGKVNDGPVTLGEKSNIQLEDVSFRRRQVRTNWDRYEGLSDGEEEDRITQRGADFGLLLNVASNSLSQFRFSDEQDWDQGLSSTSDILSIDCVSLASSLQSIPLDIRLGISKDHFTEDQLDLFRVSAEKHLKTYIEQKASASSKPENIEVDLWEDDGSRETEEFVVDDFIPPLSPKSAPLQPEAAPKQIVRKADNKSVEKTVNKRSKSHQTKTNLAEGTNPLGTAARVEEKGQGTLSITAEDDLDMLLQLDTHIMNKSKTEEIDDILDDIPAKSEAASDHPEASKSDEVSTKTDAAPNYTEASKSDVASVSVPSSTTNLEDWLDDLLED